MRIITKPFSLRNKRRKRKLKKKSLLLNKLKILLSAGFTAGLSIFILILFITTIAYSSLTTNLPSIDILPLLLSHDGYLRTPTTIYDRTSTQIIHQFSAPRSENSRYLPIEKIPAYVIYATLAASDPSFYEHVGYQLNDFSTLEIQIIEDYLLWSEVNSPIKQLRAKILASQIYEIFGKEKILEWYINNVNYGNYAFGIDQAAWAYFNKSAEDLSLAEAALLAPLAISPEINPIVSPQLSLENQSVTLNKMVAKDFISIQQATNANLYAIDIILDGFEEISNSPFVDLILHQLTDDIPEEYLIRGGLEIVSTQNFTFQEQLNCATTIQLSKINQISNNNIPNLSCESDRFLPTLPRKEQNAYTGVKAAATIIDPKNGHILAMVGNSTIPQSAGSTLTPYIYLTGFTRGLSPATLTWDTPNNLPSFMDDYGNFDGDYHGPIRLRTAFANDYIIPALNILNQVGPTNVWQTAQQAGLYSLDIPTGKKAFQFILDQSFFSLLNLTHAYSLFSNQGRLAGYTPKSNPTEIHPLSVITVKDIEGRIYVNWGEPTNSSVISPQLSYLITDILSDNLSRQDSLGQNNPLETGRPSAAKIGQTFDGRSSWTLGYTPDLMIGIWMGYENTDKSSAPAISPLISAGLWHATIQYTHSNIPTSNWNIPNGLKEVEVCVPSGMLPTSICPFVTDEIFLPGSEPVQSDSLFQSFLVNQQTGRLATINSPNEYVIEKTYLVVPPEYTEWAIEAGYEIPPTQFDVIFSTASLNDDVKIASPGNFQYLAGEIPITGIATGEDFLFYRIQVGNGLNPRQWLQVGDIEDQPIDNDLLVIWDTTGLNGLYAIQLQVVAIDQSIQTDTVQVTLDNTPPTVSIIFPTEGQKIIYPTESNITIQTEIEDNLGIDFVSFYLNDQLISTLNNPPFTPLWIGELGTFTLRVVAVDLAGNPSETSLTFEVSR